MICAVMVARAERGSDADLAAEAAYRTAVNAIKSNNFVLMADILTVPGKTIPNPDPRETFIMLDGEWGHTQMDPLNPYVISGKVSNVKTKIKKNGSVEQSMRIMSDRRGANVAIVNITMRKGSNNASATVFFDKSFNNTVTYTMTGRIVPSEDSGVIPAFEKSGITEFMNPVVTF